MIKTHQNEPNAQVTIEEVHSLEPAPQFNPTPQERPADPNEEILNEMEQLSVASMIVAGIPADLIEERLNRPPGFITTLRSNPKFRVILKNCIELRAQSVTADADNPEELLDSQINDSIGALMQVRDDPFEKGSSRVKAAEGILNRAPAAPKPRKEVEQTRRIIALPVSALQNMQQALLEEGSKQDLETIELLEGTDYNIRDSEIESVVSEEGEIVVERIE